jgi:hypothetical protein
MKEKFYYIVGVSLLVLLVLIVYVGSRVQNIELGLMNADNRLTAIEAQLGISNVTSYYGETPAEYGASAYDAFYADGTPVDYYEYPYEYVVE